MNPLHLAWQWCRQDFDKEGAEVYRARNFDHAHLITSRAAPRGMYVRTYGYDMGWRGAIERVIVTYVNFDLHAPVDVRAM